MRLCMVRVTLVTVVMIVTVCLFVSTTSIAQTCPHVGFTNSSCGGGTGSVGPAGTNGATWLSGSGVPSNAAGSDGDYYLRTSTGDIYIKTFGAWNSPIANITGPQGVAGATGATGAAGATGTTGATGAAGADGIPKTILDEGSALTQRLSLNFIGSGVTCVDNSGASRTDCTIPGSSGIGGDVGSTDRVVTITNGTGGSTLQSSGVTIDSSNNIITSGSELKITGGYAAIRIANGVTLYITDIAGNNIATFDASGNLILVRSAAKIQAAFAQLAPLVSAATACAGSTEGAIFYYSVNHVLCFCDGTSWQTTVIGRACP